MMDLGFKNFGILVAGSPGSRALAMVMVQRNGYPLSEENVEDCGAFFAHSWDLLRAWQDKLAALDMDWQDAVHQGR